MVLQLRNYLSIAGLKGHGCRGIAGQRLAWRSSRGLEICSGLEIGVLGALQEAEGGGFTGVDDGDGDYCGDVW